MIINTVTIPVMINVLFILHRPFIKPVYVLDHFKRVLFRRRTLK
jgi:hypothetical protein